MSRDDYGSGEHYVDRLVETAVLRSIVPDPMLRRGFLQAVGALAALAAIAEVFPLAASKAMAQQTAALEKTKVTVGFVPITCTVPILLAHAMGEYQKEGLEVNVARTPGLATKSDEPMIEHHCGGS
jgi:nitrate/nitrite transport system substrate-binding protein